MKINDNLLISYLQGELTADEAMDIEAWLNKDFAHRQRYNEFKVLWERSLDLRFDGEIDVEASLERLRQKKALQKEVVKNQTVFPRTPLWLKIAAVVLVISSIGWFFFNKFQGGQRELMTQGSVRTDTLSDGSVITLNKNSLLLYPNRFSAKIRQVWLSKGEAFFNIRPDRAKPFLIHTGKTVIKVVGTSFNVKNKRGLIEIIVETGLVIVSRNGQVISLKPGEKISVQAKDGKMMKEQIPDHLYKYYRSKEFVAEDTPLWRMVQVLNDAYDSHIILGREELKDLPLNTTFKDESLDDILQVICRTFKIKTEKKNNLIILY